MYGPITKNVYDNIIKDQSIIKIEGSTIKYGSRFVTIKPPCFDPENLVAIDVYPNVAL